MIKRIEEQLRNKDMGLELTDNAKKFLAKKGYDPVLGARPLRRTIQRELEDTLSERILFQELKPGQNVLVDCEGDPEQIETSKLTFTGSTAVRPAEARRQRPSRRRRLPPPLRQSKPPDRGNARFGGLMPAGRADVVLKPGRCKARIFDGLQRAEEVVGQRPGGSASAARRRASRPSPSSGSARCRR